MVDNPERTSGARRAQWLADLAAALEEAARLTSHVGDEAGGVAIRQQIAVVRSEVDQARHSRFSGVEQEHPNRIESSQWWGE